MKYINTGNRLNIFLAILFLFLFIIVLVFGINNLIFLDINSLGKVSGSFLWSNLTFLGDTLPVCAVMVLFIRKMPVIVWSGLISTILATLIVNILKHYLDIPRPASVIDKNIINIIGPALYAHSFPSGHTVTIFTFTGLLINRFRSAALRFIMILLAVLVGISRIVVGAHWPEDVLGGAVIGMLCSMAGIYIVSKYGWNKSSRVQLTVCFLLILADLYMIFFYDCRYPKAVYLQLVLGISALIYGAREFYLLFENSYIRKQ